MSEGVYSPSYINSYNLELKYSKFIFIILRDAEDKNHVSTTRNGLQTATIMTQELKLNITKKCKRKT